MATNCKSYLNMHEGAVKFINEVNPQNWHPSQLVNTMEEAFNSGAIDMDVLWREALKRYADNHGIQFAPGIMNEFLNILNEIVNEPKVHEFSSKPRIGDTARDYLDIVIGINKNVPFANYRIGHEAEKNLQIINVVFFDPGREHGGKARMPIIIIEKDGKYQDFYWNGFFKMLSEPSDPKDPFTPAQWWEEERLGIECPEWFKEMTDLELILR